MSIENSFNPPLKALLDYAKLPKSASFPGVSGKRQLLQRSIRCQRECEANACTGRGSAV
jgi:hypothetical protein